MTSGLENSECETNSRHMADEGCCWSLWKRMVYDFRDAGISEVTGVLVIAFVLIIKYSQLLLKLY